MKKRRGLFGACCSKFGASSWHSPKFSEACSEHRWRKSGAGPKLAQGFERGAARSALKKTGGTRAPLSFVTPPKHTNEERPEERPAVVDDWALHRNRRTGGLEGTRPATSKQKNISAHARCAMTCGRRRALRYIRCACVIVPFRCGRHAVPAPLVYCSLRAQRSCDARLLLTCRTRAADVPLESRSRSAHVPLMRRARADHVPRMCLCCAAVARRLGATCTTCLNEPDRMIDEQMSSRATPGALRLIVEPSEPFLTSFCWSNNLQLPDPPRAKVEVARKCRTMFRE